jgi:hypothetical protein
MAEGHDVRVYDRSDVTDLIVEITGTGRTNGVRVVALLRSETPGSRFAARTLNQLALQKLRKTDFGRPLEAVATKRLI